MPVRVHMRIGIEEEAFLGMLFRIESKGREQITKQHVLVRSPLGQYALRLIDIEFLCLPLEGLLPALQFPVLNLDTARDGEQQHRHLPLLTPLMNVIQGLQR